MDPALRPFYEKVKDVQSEEDFLARVQGVSERFAGLLDDEAVALYVVDEAGRNEGAVVTLSECAGRADATVRVEVCDLGDVREFERGEGQTGRVRNVVVEDPTGEARLVLWDRDVEKTEDGTLKPGDRVKVVNARVKDSRFGLELHVTRWTALEVEGALDAAARKLLMDTQDGYDPVSNRVEGARTQQPQPQQPQEPARPAGQATLDVAEARPSDALPVARLADVREGDDVPVLRVRVRGVQPTRPFRRADGSTGFVANVDVEDDSGPGRLTLWDDAVKSVVGLPEGAHLEVTDLVAKSRYGRMELHSTFRTGVKREDA